MTTVCVTTSEPLWLFITGVSACGALGASEELTSSFFPRINFPSQMRILLWYPTVPDLILSD